MIIAFVTLQEDFTQRPLAALGRKILELQRGLHIPRAWVLEAHFTHNRPWAKIVSGSIGTSLGNHTIPTTGITAGTFQQHATFFRFVKHLGFQPEEPAKALAGAQTDSVFFMKGIMDCCDSVLTVTLYSDKLKEETAASIRVSFTTAVAASNRALKADPQRRILNRKAVTLIVVGTPRREQWLSNEKREAVEH